MNENAYRIALRIPEAWAELTPRQTEVVRAFIVHGTLAATARHLDVNRNAVRQTLRYAGKKFLAFARVL